MRVTTSSWSEQIPSFHYGVLQSAIAEVVHQSCVGQPDVGYLVPPGPDFLQSNRLGRVESSDQDIAGSLPEEIRFDNPLFRKTMPPLPGPIMLPQIWAIGNLDNGLMKKPQEYPAIASGEAVGGRAVGGMILGGATSGLVLGHV